MKVLSFGDLDLSENSDYEAHLFTGYSTPEQQLVTVTRDQGAPVTTRANEGLFTMVLQVWFGDTSADVLRRRLLAGMDTRTGAKSLVVSEEDDSRSRYVLCFVRAAQPIDGQGNLGYAFTLVVTEDNRWRATTEDEYNLTWTTSGDTETVTNDGDLDAYPLITITPRAVKDEPGYRYMRQLLFFPPRVVEGENDVARIPVSPNHTVWEVDTESMVSDGKAVTSADLAIQHGNGKWELPWFTDDDGAYDFGTEATKIWRTHTGYANFTEVYLGESLANDSTQTRLKIDRIKTEARGESGHRWLNRWGLLYDSWAIANSQATEFIVYEGYDEVTGELLNVRRAQFGSVAEDHDNGSALALSTVNLRLLYGPNVQPPAQELAAAENEQTRLGPPIVERSESGYAFYYGYRYNTFKDRFGDPNNSGWNLFRFAGSHPNGIFVKPSDATGTAIREISLPYTALGFVAGLPVNSQWQLHLNMPLRYVTLTVRYKRGASSSAHPFLPALVATNLNQTTRVILWQPTDATENNTLRTVAIDVAEVAAGVSSSELLSLHWECNGSTHVQVDIQSLYVSVTNAYTTQVGPEVGLYDMRLKLVNETTGEELWIDVPPSTTDQSVVIDCANHTCVFGDNDENVYGMVKREGTDRLRPFLLRLAPGDNVIRVDEDGLTDVDVDINFRKRYYA